MTDWKKFVEGKRDESAELFARMDADRNLAIAYPYALKDAGGRAVKGIYNVTLPDPKLFAHRAVIRLLSVERQTAVESGTLTDEETSLIERFLDDLSYEADALRAAAGEPDVFTSHAETVCLRGPIAEQLLLKPEGDRHVADVRPLDTRYFLFEPSLSGIERAVVVTERAAADIYAEYGR